MPCQVVPCRERLPRRRPDRTTGVRPLVLAAVLLLLGALWVSAAGAATQSYYVGCDGHDSSSGRSPGTAWRSLTRSTALRSVPVTRCCCNVVVLGPASGST
jgi:hypothetical protein